MSLPLKFLVVGIATFASRIGGFLRDALIAALLGAGGIADAVFAAFLLPNLARRMLTEGAFNAAFIPIFARRTASGGPVSAASFAGSVLITLLLVLALLFGAAMLSMPQIVTALVGGFRDDPAKFADTVLFSRIAFGYVIAITLTAFFAAVLNANRRYRFAAAVPVLFNLLMVLVLVVMLVTGLSDLRSGGLIIVSLIAGAGVLQLVFIIAVSFREGSAIRLSGNETWRDKDVLRFALLLLPGVAVAGAGHINMLIAVHLASAEPAAVSWLYYADRLFQLPLGLVATSIGIVMLPDIAKHLHDADHGAYRAAFSRALEFALALALPAALALILLAKPIVEVLYRHGSFGHADVSATATVLAALACGLPAFVLVKVLLPGFLARETFGWPILAGAAAVVANIVATDALRPMTGFSAPAWGVTASAWVNAALLAIGLANRREFGLDRMAMRNLPRVLAVTAVSGCFIASLSAILSRAFAEQPVFLVKVGLLALACFIGVAIQGVGLMIAGVIDRDALIERWRSRKRQAQAA